MDNNNHNCQMSFTIIWDLRRALSAENLLKPHVVTVSMEVTG